VKPAEEVRRSQALSREAAAQPAPSKAKMHPSHPTLDERERALLTFISEHPDAPVSSVYKGMGVSVWKGNEIRERLKVLGLLVELELRTGTTGAGRPMKCILPTLQALELLEIAPPPGRGGAVHRHIQQIIKDGATNKGYSAQVEKELPTGAIVDVHLEKGTERIAVEVAVASTPEREVSHMKHCISRKQQWQYRQHSLRKKQARYGSCPSVSLLRWGKDDSLIPRLTEFIRCPPFFK
jgi:hypothetical protein